jgi:hypothetical protein
MIKRGVRSRVRATALRNGLVDRSIKRDPNWVNWPEDDLTYMSKGKMADLDDSSNAEDVAFISAPAKNSAMSSGFFSTIADTIVSTVDSVSSAVTGEVTYPTLFPRNTDRLYPTLYSTPASMPALVTQSEGSSQGFLSSAVSSLVGPTPTAPFGTGYDQVPDIYGDVPATEYFTDQGYDNLRLRPRLSASDRRMNKQRHPAEQARLEAIMNAPPASMNAAIDPVEQARQTAMMNAAPADAMNAPLDPVEKARAEAMMNADKISPADVEAARAAAMVDAARSAARPNIVVQAAQAVVSATNSVADAVTSTVSAVTGSAAVEGRSDYDRAKAKFYRAYRNQPGGRRADRNRQAKTVVTDVDKYTPKRNDFKGLDDTTGVGAFARS